jgi:hypothetical protein
VVTAEQAWERPPPEDAVDALGRLLGALEQEGL